jgi:hypothetical protein
MSEMSEPKRVVGRPFQKGQSGNPGGKVRKLAAIEALAQQAGAAAR